MDGYLHCAGCLHCLGRSYSWRARGREVVEWSRGEDIGTGKSEAGAMASPLATEEEPEYPGLKHHLSHHYRLETDWPYLTNRRSVWNDKLSIWELWNAQGTIIKLLKYFKVVLTIFTVAKISKYVITLFREGDLVNGVSDETSLQ